MAEGNLISSNINLGLPAAVPENFTNPEVRAAVQILLNAMQSVLLALENATGFTQKEASLWSSMTPGATLLRQNQGRFYCIASENLNYGAFVHIWNDGGIVKARNANSTDHTKPARGYCNETDGAIAGSYTEIILSLGLIRSSGLAPGQKIYLSTVNGLAALTPDVAAGHLEQFLGFGVGNDLVYVDISQGTYIEH